MDNNICTFNASRALEDIVRWSKAHSHATTLMIIGRIIIAICCFIVFVFIALYYYAPYDASLSSVVVAAVIFTFPLWVVGILLFVRGIINMVKARRQLSRIVYIIKNFYE